MNSQQIRDMEARSSKCRAANVELSRILNRVDRLQARTAVTKHKKEAIMGRLDKIMDIIDVKMEETTVYRGKKEEQAQGRLQEMGIQAKTAQDHKLADLEEQLFHGVMLICDQLDKAEEQASKVEEEKRWACQHGQIRSEDAMAKFSQQGKPIIYSKI